MCKETGPSPSHCSLGVGWDAAGGWLGGKSILVFFFPFFSRLLLSHTQVSKNSRKPKLIMWKETNAFF